MSGEVEKPDGRLRPAAASERPARDDTRAGGEPALRTIAMPADTNSEGDIFGGWLLSQMDLAGGVVARQTARGRTATVAIDSMVFYKPVHVGDLVSCFVTVQKIGRSSITVRVDAWAQRGRTGETVHVTGGTFTYVAIGPDGKARPVPGG